MLESGQCEWVEKKLADKPGSVPTLLWATVIHLGARLLVRSSSLPGSSASHAITTLFGFAPDGGYRVSPGRRELASSLVDTTRLCGPVPRLTAYGR